MAKLLMQNEPSVLLLMISTLNQHNTTKSFWVAWPDSLYVEYLEKMAPTIPEYLQDGTVMLICMWHDEQMKLNKFKQMKEARWLRSLNRLGSEHSRKPSKGP